MGLVSIDDLKAGAEFAWNPSLDGIANQKLKACIAMVKARIPDIDKRISTGILDLDILKDVIVTAVLRVVRNPSGYTQTTEGQVSYSQRGDVASGYLTIYPDEWERLGVQDKGGAFNIKVGSAGHGRKGHVCSINTPCGFDRIFYAEGTQYRNDTPSQHGRWLEP